MRRVTTTTLVVVVRSIVARNTVVGSRGMGSAEAWLAAAVPAAAAARSTPRRGFRADDARQTMVYLEDPFVASIVVRLG